MVIGDTNRTGKRNVAMAWLNTPQQSQLLKFDTDPLEAAWSSTEFNLA
tara:strand:+ start:85 stop:228 length:144 start_codon:yes stop_codon:yes gene_type:complete